jgi:hypothetical protein
VPSKKDQGSPPDYPATPPPSASPGDFGYFEFVTDVHKSLGMLTEAVSGLKEAVKELKTEQREQGKKIEDELKEQSKRINGMGRKIYAGIAIITVLGFILGLLAPSIKNLISRPAATPTTQQQVPK